jgi:HAD superfamily phosphatase (TIGR01668 family)
MMFDRYYPDVIVDGFRDISPELLEQLGVSGLILDIDNTLVPTHTKEADGDVLKWLTDMKSRGIKMCIVSNASQKRVVKFNEKLELYAIHRAFKPRQDAFRKAAKIMGLGSGSIAVVGDQLFTDVKGGNKAGMKTILVKPLHKKEFFFVKMKRVPEKIVLYFYNKRKLRRSRG